MAGGTRTSVGTITCADPNSTTIQEYSMPASGFRYLVIYRTAGTVDMRLDGAVLNYYSCTPATVTAVDDNINVTQDLPVTFDVRNNDLSPGDLPLTLTILQYPKLGNLSLNLDSSITYINRTDVYGVDSFQYQICNTQNICSTAKVYLTISNDGCPAKYYKPLDFTAPVTKTFSGTILTYDGQIREDGANYTKNYGGNATAEVGKKTNNRRRFLIEIPNNNSANSFRGQIPSNAIIQSATIRYTVTGGDNTTLSLSTYRVTGSPNWDEASMTYRDRRTGLAWSNPGADFISTPIATQTVTRPGTADNGDKLTFNILSAVNIWQADTSTNRGIILAQTISGNQIDKKFVVGTSENGTSTNQPLFSITYVLPKTCELIPNRTPLANPDTAVTASDQAVSINVLANDHEPDSTRMTVSIVGAVSGGTANVSGSNIIFTPSGTFTGTVSFKYRVVDSLGLADTSLVIVTITNVAPLASKDISSVISNASVTISVKNNDNDLDGPASGAPFITFDPLNGLATISVNAIQYSPTTNFTGTDTLIYQICENSSSSCGVPPLCDTAIVIINVLNQAPIANRDIKTTSPCQTTIIEVLGNDYDPENGNLTITIATPPANGTATVVDGNIRYTPNPGFSRQTDQLVYNLCDNGSPALCDTAIVFISVSNGPQNKRPVAANDFGEGIKNQPVYWDILSNDYDPDNDALKVSLPAAGLKPANGTVALSENNLIIYTPNSGYVGLDSMDYQICDTFPPVSGGCIPVPNLCTTARFYVTITVQDFWQAYEGLPVELIEFRATAMQEEKTIKLDWTTASEINNAYFDVERSSDGINFSKIGQIKGAVTSNKVNIYTFIDANAAQGQRYYYRLKQTDINGDYSYTKIASALLLDDKQFTITEFYPNPAINSSAVSIMSAINTELKVQLFQTDGILIREEKAGIIKGYNEIKLDVSMLPKGIYFVQFKTPDDAKWVRKLLKLNHK